MSRSKSDIEHLLGSLNCRNPGADSEVRALFQRILQEEPDHGLPDNVVAQMMFEVARQQLRT